MKFFYPLFALIALFIQDGIAQDWSLVMPNDTLVYERQDNNQFFTVWVDSTQINGTDTIYFMNRITPGDYLGPSDTSDHCSSDSWAPISFRLKKNRPQFIGSKIECSNSKTTVWHGSISYVIYPEKSLGSSWICDSTNFDSMRIISVDTAFLPLFQSIDSVKVFEYKNQMIRLSKNHGLLSTFDFNDTNVYTFSLEGVQNLQLGDIIPMARDIYDFEIGDIFYRESGGGDSDEIRTTVSKTRILSKTVRQDSIIYSVQINSQLHTYSPQWGGSRYYPKQQIVTTLRYAINDSGGLENSLSGSLGKVKNQYWGVNTLSSTAVFKNNLNQIEKRNVDPYMGYPLVYPFVIAFCDRDSFLVQQYIYGSDRVYIKNLGKVKDSYNGGLSIGFDNLIGYIKASGESWGDTLFTGVSEPDYTSDFILSPNPASTVLNIYNPLIIKNVTMEVYGIHGELVHKQTITLPYQADVSRYSPGVYIILISDEKGKVMLREKIVIQ